MAQMRELPRYSLLAEAIAGRRVGVIGTDEERGYTDGESIYVPEPVGPLTVVGLVAQAALLASGSFEPAVMARLAGRRVVRLRYLTLEAARATRTQSAVVPRKVADLINDVYQGPVPGSPQESLSWAAGGKPIPEAPVWLGTVKPIRVLRAGVTDGGAPTDDDLTSTSWEEQVREFDDEEEFERSRILELFSAPIRNPLASAIQRFFGMGRTPGEGGGGAELPVGGKSRGPVGANARQALSAAGAELGLAGVPLGRRYPEWDYRRGRYRREWCAVAEFDPPPTNADSTAIATVDRRLLKQLARVGLAQERHRRQPDGDGLDPTALVELVADRATGHQGDERVYEIRRPTAHDLGVLVLLDATGSTGESTEGRRVFDEQRLVAARLTAALEELGDRVAMFGFYSRGRDAVRYLRIKDFDGRFDRAARRRLAALDPGGYTRLGAAVRHGTHLLDTRAGTSQKLLVVIGDGLPYEDGYEHRYAQEDSRRALLEAVAAGVGCACLSVRASTEDEVLHRVWGDVPHRRLEDPGSLAEHVRPLFAEAIRAARASRRPERRIAA